ncbi:SpoIIE family protein phosphatase [Kineococcus sp. SYSU DK006]|uniref:SpoIIE family protein phosphatase n=1 Tax=Kineococcus sp. SYSU DK006 TaxID=3383127 RepID=UPI003D7E97D8
MDGDEGQGPLPADARRLADLALLALDLSAATTVHEVHEALVARGLPLLGADGCGVVTRADDGGWRLALSTSFGPDLRARYEHEPHDSPLPACRAAREGVRVLVPDRAAAERVHPRMAEVVDLTGRERWALLPLLAGSQVVGSLAVCWERPGEFTEQEVALLEAFAAHCAPTLDRVLEARAARRAAAAVARVARELQRSVLGHLPSPEGVRLAVRCTPAAEGAGIGGDWYDAFTDRAGDLVVAVGDVTGHDEVAAASMNQVRTLLRGVSWDSGDGPARLLDRLDAVVCALEPGTLATAVLVLVGTGAAGGAGGDPGGGSGGGSGGLRVRWASAGHVAPLLRHPDGRVELLPDGDLLLGVDPAAVRGEHVLDLPAGAALLLYTDGVVEDRASGTGGGTERLAGVLATGDPSEPDALCGELLSVGAGGGEDDRTALLLVAAAGAGQVPAGGAAPAAGEAAPAADEGPSTTRVIVLPPDPRSAREARTVVREVCARCGWGEDDASTAELLTSELVTNAVVHGRSDARVTVTSSGDRLLVQVHDGNDRPPQVLTEHDDALNGRGMRLVDGGASAWGVRQDADGGRSGKVVWFSLERA